MMKSDLFLTRRMDRQETAEIYQQCLIRDFPPEEVKPLSEIHRLMEANRYDTLCFYEGETQVGYAFLFRSEAQELLLLDYLAVEPDWRGHGIGHRILSELKLRYAAYRGIFIECEDPSALPDQGEAMNRISFYLDAGARDTSVCLNLYDVVYKLFYLPCSDESTLPDAETLLSVYREMMTPENYRAHLKKITERSEPLL